MTDTETLAADYIEESMELVQTLVKEKEELQQKVAELSENNILLEKVAAEKEEAAKKVEEASEDLMPAFSDEKINSTVEKLVKLSYISPVYSEQVSEEIKKDPSTVLDLLDKISEVSTSLPNSGVGISKQSSVDSVDPDGWTRLKD
jgi:hypothetical protein